MIINFDAISSLYKYLNPVTPLLSFHPKCCRNLISLCHMLSQSQFWKALNLFIYFICSSCIVYVECMPVPSFICWIYCLFRCEVRSREDTPKYMPVPLPSHVGSTWRLATKEKYSTIAHNPDIKLCLFQNDEQNKGQYEQHGWISIEKQDPAFTSQTVTNALSTDLLLTSVCLVHLYLSQFSLHQV